MSSASTTADESLSSSDLPSPPGLLSSRSQGIINRWFTHYRFSFNNPEDIAVRLTQIKKRHKRRRPNRILPGNCDIFLRVLAEISLMPNHRHRRDAANIFHEVNARMKGETEEELLPDPLRFRRPENRVQAAGEPLPIVAGILPPGRPPGGPIPDVSVRRIHLRYASATPALPPENEGLFEAAARWIPDSGDFMTAMQNFRSMGADDPDLHEPLLADHPLEVVMEFPEDIPFITAPLPQVDPALQRAERTPLTIYDTRAWTKGARGAINPDHYIYNLIDLFRTKLLHPSVAAKYAIVNRAHPSRYRMGSMDNIADEPPPSAGEVEGVMRWILHGFPVIEILSDGFTQGGREAMDGSYAYVPRTTRHSHKLCLNALFFNTIEQAYREGEDFDAIVFLLFATVTHEFGHYLNTCWHIGADHRSWFRTPRGMRYLVQLIPTEDQEHPDYDPEHLISGEIGQVIEWLIFGFMPGMVGGANPTAWLAASLFILGWGSRPRNLLHINHHVCRRLMQTRPHLRMTASELRVFTKNLRREQESKGTGPVDLGDGDGDEEGTTGDGSADLGDGGGDEEGTTGGGSADLGDGGGDEEGTTGGGSPEPRTPSPAPQASTEGPMKQVMVIIERSVA
ncbi:hypothetical protein HOY82DRAFT_667615 [Tuber indicum]|nr:hypothetical protein HOY82DRAFT_667615 [Tuber indicum]